jgi:hypothetical protein
MVHKQAWSIKNYRYIWDVSHPSTTSQYLVAATDTLLHRAELEAGRHTHSIPRCPVWLKSEDNGWPHPDRRSTPVCGWSRRRSMQCPCGSSFPCWIWDSWLVWLSAGSGRRWICGGATWLSISPMADGWFGTGGRLVQWGRVESRKLTLSRITELHRTTLRACVATTGGSKSAYCIDICTCVNMCGYMCMCGYVCMCVYVCGHECLCVS